MEIIRDVGGGEFEAQVVDRSREVPVLVDFWAAWCGPCRQLGPVLERLVGELGGEIELAKVDTDTNQEVAARFGVRGIPNVLLFRDGEVVDQFVGALPEAQVRAFLKRNVPGPADRAFADGQRSSGLGDRAGAAEAYRRALAIEPRHGGANLELARQALAGGRIDEVEPHLAAIPAGAAEFEAAQHVRAALELGRECAAAGGEAACRGKLAGDARDLDARIALGACLAAAGRYREALDELLAAVAQDKKYRDGAARRAMLTVFGLIGVRSPLADEYREKLSLAIH